MEDEGKRLGFLAKHLGDIMRAQLPTDVKYFIMLASDTSEVTAGFSSDIPKSRIARLFQIVLKSIARGTYGKL